MTNVALLICYESDYTSKKNGHDGHLTASTSLEIPASVPSIPSTYIIIAFHVLFICHESEHFPKALFKSDGHLAGPGIVIVVEEAVSVLCFLLHCCTAVHPTYARDLTIGWTGEKWRVGSKQMVALYKTAGRDMQMLSFEGAASTTPTYRPPAFHNLTPPSSWGWCVSQILGTELEQWYKAISLHDLESRLLNICDKSISRCPKLSSSCWLGLMCWARWWWWTAPARCRRRRWASSWRMRSGMGMWWGPIGTQNCRKY